MVELLALVVEDSMVHRKLLLEAAKDCGMPLRLDIFPDAESAWQAIERMPSVPRSEWPHFALVDIGLPGASGIDLVDRIRQRPRFDGWPVVMLTASTDPDDRSEAMLADATAYFVKPVTGSGYTRILRQILEFLELGDAPGRPLQDNQPARKRSKASPSGRGA